MHRNYVTLPVARKLIADAVQHARTCLDTLKSGQPQPDDAQDAHNWWDHGAIPSASRLVDLLEQIAGELRKFA